MVERNPEAIEYILREARENDVKFIRLWFTDILGNLKGFAITVEELESALTRGMGFDGSTIEGYARSVESDMYALPDPNTFSLLPWRPRTNAVARMFCDIITPGEEPFEGDPRFVLQRNVERAATMGFTYYVGPEIEYFYFKDSSDADAVDYGGYFDQGATDLGTDLRRETVLMLEELGIPVESSHHEVAPSQHEIDLRHTDALTMGRHGDDDPAGGQRDSHEARSLRHLYAQADDRAARQRHARAAVAVQGGHQRLLRLKGRAPHLRDGEPLHRRPHAPRQGDHCGHEPVGQLIQAPRPQVRGPDLRVVGRVEPLRSDPCTRLQARARGVQACRVPGSRRGRATPTWHSA